MSVTLSRIDTHLELMIFENTKTNSAKMLSPVSFASPTCFSIFPIYYCALSVWLHLIYPVMETDTLEMVAVHRCDFSVLLFCGFSEPFESPSGV